MNTIDMEDVRELDGHLSTPGGVALMAGLLVFVLTYPLWRPALWVWGKIKP